MSFLKSFKNSNESDDFITNTPNKKIDELVKQGHAVVTQTSADLFGSDKVESTFIVSALEAYEI